MSRIDNPMTAREWTYDRGPSLDDNYCETDSWAEAFCDRLNQQSKERFDMVAHTNELLEKIGRVAG